MLPERLQSAKGPAEALADQGVGGIGRFGPADGFFGVGDSPAAATDGDGQIGIFGDRVRGETAGLADGRGTPGAERSGNDRDAVQQIEGALLKILTGDVFQRLPAGDPGVAVADLDVAGDRADAGIDHVAHHAADGVGSDGGIGVDGDQNVVVRGLERVGEGDGLAAVELMDDLHARVGCRSERPAAPPVRSCEPSSTTTTSSEG